jgi:hypothetical protein
MTLEMMKELFCIAHIGEEEVPNVKRMRIGEEEVSLSRSCQRKRMLQSHCKAPLSRSHRRKKSHWAPLSLSRWRKRRSHSRSPPVAVSLEGRGFLVTVDDNGPDDEGTVLPLVSSSPFFFSQKCRRFFLPFFQINSEDL